MPDYKARTIIADENMVFICNRCRNQTIHDQHEELINQQSQLNDDLIRKDLEVEALRLRTSQKEDTFNNTPGGIETEVRRRMKEKQVVAQQHWENILTGKYFFLRGTNIW